MTIIYLLAEHGERLKSRIRSVPRSVFPSAWSNSVTLEGH